MIAVYSTEWYELRNAAASMYDGGWRAEDRDDIREQIRAEMREEARKALEAEKTCYEDPNPIVYESEIDAWIEERIEEHLDIMCEIMRELAEEDAEA